VKDDKRSKNHQEQNWLAASGTRAGQYGQKSPNPAAPATLPDQVLK